MHIYWHACKVRKHRMGQSRNVHKQVLIMYSHTNHDKACWQTSIKQCLTTITHLHKTDKEHVGMGKYISGLFGLLPFTGCGYFA